HLKNEISRFTQRFEETFGEAWERSKEILRACPHHRFSKLTQIDTFYNGLNEQDQDSLNATAGGNILSQNRRRVPNIVEPEIRTIEEVIPMADQTMVELLQAPTEGYGEAIVIPEILAENFDIKTSLLQ
nr:reverse transcriptase domain-containing protein [Tanacetum cinerariifolium]